MRVISIIEETMADGPGLRTSVYLAGCKHRCPGCHNPETWNFNQGDIWDPYQLALKLTENPYTNITFSGGDPLFQLEELTRCCQYIKELSDKNIWVYTGFPSQEVLYNKKYQPLLQSIDTIVTEPYVEALRDTTLPFRGSSNQRILNIKEVYEAINGGTAIG